MDEFSPFTNSDTTKGKVDFDDDDDWASFVVSSPSPLSLSFALCQSLRNSVVCSVCLCPNNSRARPPPPRLPLSSPPPQILTMMISLGTLLLHLSTRRQLNLLATLLHLPTSMISRTMTPL